MSFDVHIYYMYASRKSSVVRACHRPEVDFQGMHINISQRAAALMLCCEDVGSHFPISTAHHRCGVWVWGVVVCVKCLAAAAAAAGGDEKSAASTSDACPGRRQIILQIKYIRRRSCF